MKKLLIIFILSLTYQHITLAQEILSQNPDTSVQTLHQTTIKGKIINYRATVGTQPVRNTDGKIVAAVQYTLYERMDIKDKNVRPIIISFNGGPGSASVWMHLAYTGPYILNVDDEGFPIQPYGVKKNPYSILDIADIVYVNPINTGYSRIIDKEYDSKNFFGVNADIKYLATWINTFITRINRWESPKYLIGESYGTTRVAGLSLELQNAQWMYLNGVILVSPTELGIDTGIGRREGPLGAALRMPYFTAAAWYHKKLDANLQSMDLLDLLKMVENKTIDDWLPKLMRGGSINEQIRLDLAKELSYFSGISYNSFLHYNLDVPVDYFWKELLREEGYTIGRLDSRYKGLDKNIEGDEPDFNSELTSWLHSFTPAINFYFKNILNFHTDIKYNMFGPVSPWDWSYDNTGENLRQAMAQNPFLHTMVQSGYYDGATMYFDAKYTLWHLDKSGRLQNRISFKGYRSGHMMYLRKEDLIQANEDIREFIQNTTPKSNQPAKY